MVSGDTHSFCNRIGFMLFKVDTFSSIKEAEKGPNWQAWTFMCRLVTPQEWKVQK
jgi:hypothetical protein